MPLIERAARSPIRSSRSTTSNEASSATPRGVKPILFAQPIIASARSRSPDYHSGDTSPVGLRHGWNHGWQGLANLDTPSHRRAVVDCPDGKKLILRDGPALDARKVGHLYSGKVLIILEEQIAESSAIMSADVRARVGEDSWPRGSNIHQLGWVTSVKDGERRLSPLEGEEASWVVAPTRLPSARTAGKLLDGSMMDGGSMASRIARRRRENLESRMERQLSQRAAATDRPQSPAFGGAGGAAGGSSADAEAEQQQQQQTAPEPSHRSKGKGGPSRPPSPPKFDAMSEAELLAKAAAITASAVAEEGRDFDTITSKLGSLLIRKGTKIDQLMVEWDRNHDGDISKTEFRLNVRKLGLSETYATTAQIDAVYDDIDQDKSNSLDLGEMRVALTAMKEEVREIKLVKDRVAKNAANLREVALTFDAASKDAADLARQEARLQMMKEGTVTSRLGELLKLRNVRVGEVVHAWDADGSGSLDFDEFYEHVVNGLAFKASVEEMEVLFHQIDTDKNGTLEIHEVMTAMKSLQDASFNAKKEERLQRRLVEEVRKKAEESQSAAFEAEAAAEAKRQEAEDAAQAAAEAKLAEEKRKQAEEREKKRLEREKLQAIQRASVDKIAKDFGEKLKGAAGDSGASFVSK